MEFLSERPEVLAKKMVGFWSRFKGETAIVVADATKGGAEDPTTGHGEVRAAIALTQVMSFRQLNCTIYFSSALARNPSLLKRLHSSRHLICLGASDTNVMTEYLLSQQQEPVFTYSTASSDPANPARKDRHVISYRGKQYETGYRTGRVGDPHEICIDYGVLACLPIDSKDSGLFTRQRWAIIAAGCHTYGTQAAAAVLANARSAATLSDIVGSKSFSLIVQIARLDEDTEEHPVVILGGSVPEFAKGEDFFYNDADLVKLTDGYCLGVRKTGVIQAAAQIWNRLRRGIRRSTTTEVPQIGFCLWPGLARASDERFTVTTCGSRPMIALNPDGTELIIESNDGWAELKRKYNNYLRNLRQRRKSFNDRLKSVPPRFFRDRDSILDDPERFKPFRGRWVAVYNERIWDAAEIDALLETIKSELPDADVDPPYVQYLPCVEESQQSVLRV
jgi:hypothetical protein